MMNTMMSEPMTFQGISEQLRRSIGALTDSSRRLQEAIIHRDTETVWAILSEQQGQMETFDKYNSLWKQLVIDTGLDSPQLRMIKQELNSEMQRLRLTNNSNASLVRSFLSAIDRAFRRVATDIGGKIKTYGKKGKMNYRQTSLLVNRVG